MHIKLKMGMCIPGRHSVLLFIFALTLSCALGELESWEDYPVILTVEYDKAIFLTPDTGCHVVEDR